MPDLLGAPSPSDEPWAELWIGAHASAPSEVEIGGSWRSLARVGRGPSGARARRARSRALRRAAPVPAEGPRGGGAALAPSASRRRARGGRMGARGSGPRAERRAGRARFPDANPKPELVCALGPFEALCAFRGARRDPRARRRARLAAPRGGARGGPGRRAAGCDPRRAPPPRTRCAARVSPPSSRSVRARRATPSRRSSGCCVWPSAIPATSRASRPLLLHHVRLAPGDALYLQPGRSPRLPARHRARGDGELRQRAARRPHAEAGRSGGRARRAARARRPSRRACSGPAARARRCTRRRPSGSVSRCCARTATHRCPAGRARRRGAALPRGRRRDRGERCDAARRSRAARRRS